MSNAVLPTPDFSLTKTLRGYTNFEADYQGQSAANVIWLSDRSSGRDLKAEEAFRTLQSQYTRQGSTFSPPLTANETSTDPAFQAGIPVPLGSKLMLWLPIVRNDTSGGLEYFVAWRLRNVEAYGEARVPYHFTETGDGRTDDGQAAAVQMGFPPGTILYSGAAKARTFIPAAWHVARFAPSYPATAADLATERIRQEVFGYPAPANVLPPEEMGFLPGIAAGTTMRPVSMQGYVPNIGYPPLYVPLVVTALGDELLVGVRPENHGEGVNYDFNSDEIEISYLFGRNGFSSAANSFFGTPLVPNPQVGVFSATGVAPLRLAAARTCPDRLASHTRRAATMNTETKVALLAILVGFLIRVLKNPSLPQPLSSIPPNARPSLAITLGCLLSVVEAVASGKPAKLAVLEGASAAGLAILGHYLGIDVLRNGKEVSLGSLSAEAKEPSAKDSATGEADPLLSDFASSDTTDAQADAHAAELRERRRQERLKDRGRAEGEDR